MGQKTVPRHRPSQLGLQSCRRKRLLFRVTQFMAAVAAATLRTCQSELHTTVPGRDGPPQPETPLVHPPVTPGLFALQKTRSGEPHAARRALAPTGTGDRACSAPRRAPTPSAPSLLCREPVPSLWRVRTAPLGGSDRRFLWGEQGHVLGPSDLMPFPKKMGVGFPHQLQKRAFVGGPQRLTARLRTQPGTAETRCAQRRTAGHHTALPYTAHPLN